MEVGQRPMEVDDLGFWRVNPTRRGTPVLQPLEIMWQFLLWKLEMMSILILLLFRAVFCLPPKIWRAISRTPRTSFEYQPLPKGHIRLLELERWIPFRRVSVRLIIVPLRDASVYEAISYTWGSEAERAKILIDGQTFWTTASTYGALRACSSSRGPMTVWIDSVCINQSNILEKNEQVAIMKNIYQEATWVSVWLGDCAKFWTGLMTVSLLNDLARLTEQRSNVDVNQRLAVMAQTGRLNALVTLLNCPWFTRVWVIQEVVVAPEVQFIYGGTRFYMETLADGLQIFLDPMASTILQSTAEGRLAYQNHLKFESMVGLRRNRAEMEHFSDSALRMFMPPEIKHQFSIPVLLTHGAKFASTKPIDKVFALQGMRSDLSHEAFRPDYTKSVQEVYINIAKYLLSRDNPFSSFAFAGIGSMTDLQEPRDWYLPSWVPDWESSLSYAPLHTPFLDFEVDDDSREDVRYNCSGDSTQPRRAHNLRSIILTADGLLVDEIDVMSEKLEARFVDRTCFLEDGGIVVHQADKCNSAYKLHQETLALAMSRGHQNADILVEAFWRTLVGDRTPTRRPAPPTLGSVYFKWVEALKYEEELHLSGAEPTPGDELWKHFQALSDFASAIGPCAVGRKFCVTKKGHFGMVPPKSEIGDKICILLGARTPFVLRRTGERYRLVGECYVHQMMDGEMMNVGLPVESFQIH